MSKKLTQKEHQLMEITNTIKRLKNMQNIYANKLKELYTQVDEIKESLMKEST
jgi:uncharacterized coiled-coil DUF342 family protein